MTAFDSSLLKIFTWLARIGSLLVIVGCILEAVELIIAWGSEGSIKKWVEEIFAKSRRKKLEVLVGFIEPRKLKFETLGFVILCFGLGLELFSSFEVESIQSKESERLTKQLDSTTQKASDAEKEAGHATLLAAKIGTTNAQLVASNQLNEVRIEGLRSNNFVLQKIVLELEAKSRWRTIDPVDKSRFIESTKSILKFPIRIRMPSNSGPEVQSFASKIRDMLDGGGFVETNLDQAIAEWPPDLQLLYKGGDPQVPSIMFINNLKTGSDVIDLREAQKTLKLFTNTQPVKMVFSLTNTDISPPPQVYNDRGSPIVVLNVASRGAFKMEAFQAVQSAFGNIGITTQWMTLTNIPEGACEVFIEPKFRKFMRPSRNHLIFMDDI